MISQWLTRISVALSVYLLVGCAAETAAHPPKDQVMMKEDFSKYSRQELVRRHEALRLKHEWTGREPFSVLAFSSDGTRLISAHYSEDRSERRSLLPPVSTERDGVAVWDVETGGLLRRFESFPHDIGSVAISDDGKTVMTGMWYQGFESWALGDDEPAPKWAIQNIDVVGETRIAGRKKVAISLSWDAPLDGKADLWDLAAGKRIARLPIDHKRLAVAIDPGGSTAFTLSGARGLESWSVATGERLRAFAGFRGGSGEVGWLAVSVDGTHVAAGTRSAGEPPEAGCLKVFRVSDGKQVPSAVRGAVGLSVGGRRALDVADFPGGDDPDGPIIVSVSEVSNAKPLWKRSFSREDGEVVAVFSLDGAKVAVASRGGGLLLLDAETGAPVPGWKGHAPWPDDRTREEFKALTEELEKR